MHNIRTLNKTAYRAGSIPKTMYKTIMYEV